MEINMAYGYVEKSEAVTDESNVYDVPEIISKPKKTGSLKVKHENGESKTKKRDYRFNVFITVFAATILLLTLIFIIFFLITNHAHNEQQNTEIKALKLLLNNSSEKLGIQLSKLKEGQLLTQNLQQQLNTTFKTSLQERIRDLEQELNKTINEQAADLQNHILELNTTYKVSLEEQARDFEQQLNNTISEQAADLQNHILELNATYKVSLEERVRDLEQQLNTTINEQAADLQNHITEQQLYNQLLGVIAEGLMKVANLDMRDSTQQCPDGFKLINRTEPPLRTCGRPDGLEGCVSTSFPVNGAEYSRVCGRIVGYQIGSPSGFSQRLFDNNIDGNYVAGISLTHGQPRQHIWTFANAQGEGFTGDQVCPCIQGSTSTVPFFIGNDYFCDSAIRDTDVNNGVFYPGDPLWDGQGCGSGSTCCEFNNPPWFCKQLPQPTTDDIEMRLCENSPTSEDDSPIEVVELYIN